MGPNPCCRILDTWNAIAMRTLGSYSIWVQAGDECLKKKNLSWCCIRCLRYSGRFRTSLTILNAQTLRARPWRFAVLVKELFSSGRLSEAKLPKKLQSGLELPCKNCGLILPSGGEAPCIPWWLWSFVWYVSPKNRVPILIFFSHRYGSGLRSCAILENQRLSRCLLVFIERCGTTEIYSSFQLANLSNGLVMKNVIL